MNLRKYSGVEIKKFLQSMDSHLNKKAELILIGGTAALLAYKATRFTQDIDSFNNINALKQAYEKAKKETGLEIPLGQAGVADAPHDFESRLQAYDKLKFKKLTIRVPEIHDFILMKMIRGYVHDLDVIEEIAKKNKVGKKILIERFEAEMGAVIGNRKTLELNFAATLARCFGERAGKDWLKSQKS